MEIRDLRQHALNILELSKRFLLEDRDLDPVAFIITADEQLLRPIELQDETAKLESLSNITSEARERHALAIITVFLARSKEFTQQPFIEEAYTWGDLEFDYSTQRCILLTLSGPGIKNWTVTVNFAFEGQSIVLKEQIESSEGVAIGFLPDWPEQAIAPKTS